MKVNNETSGLSGVIHLRLITFPVRMTSFFDIMILAHVKENWDTLELRSLDIEFT